jgi:hypothetical protein
VLDEALDVERADVADRLAAKNGIAYPRIR